MSGEIEEALQCLYEAEQVMEQWDYARPVGSVRKARQALEAHLREEETPA